MVPQQWLLSLFVLCFQRNRWPWFLPVVAGVGEEVGELGLQPPTDPGDRQAPGCCWADGCSSLLVWFLKSSQNSSG